MLTREVLLAGLRDEGARPVTDFLRDIPRVFEDDDLDGLFDFLMEQDAHIALVEYGFG